MKNKSYKAFDPAEVKRAENGEWLVNKEDTRILYDGRYCAVSGFIFAIVNNKYSILANRRGKGTPDYQGFWNCPCGFLERDETSVNGIRREIREECGINVPAKRLKVMYVETDPYKCNNGNVTIRHRAYIGKQRSTSLCSTRSEKDEVEDIKWIPLEDIEDYNWAFGHAEIIRKYAAPWIIRKPLEFYSWLNTIL